MGLIRKLSIGPDYKNAMHYTIGQPVYGGHTLVDIVETAEKYILYIEKNNEVKKWKTFNHNMAISTEDNIDFD